MKISREEYLEIIKKRSDEVKVAFSAVVVDGGGGRQYTDWSIGHSGGFIEHYTGDEDPDDVEEFTVERAHAEFDENYKLHCKITEDLVNTTWQGGNVLYDALHLVGDDPIKSMIADRLGQEFAHQSDVLDTIARTFRLCTHNY